jgi:UMF1 family MFS transporter
MPPTKDTASYFSFYDVCDKVSTVIGMATFGLATEAISTRSAIMFIMTYFIIAFFILLYTIAKQPRLQVAYN